MFSRIYIKSSGGNDRRKLEGFLQEKRATLATQSRLTFCLVGMMWGSNFL